MAYIWNHYHEDSRYKLSDEYVSPYLEVWEQQGNTVYVNGLYGRLLPFLFPDDPGAGEEERAKRFRWLYEKYLSGKQEDEEFGEAADAVLHGVAAMDRKKSLTLEDVLADIVEDEIRSGCYGSWLWQEFRKLTPDQKWILLWNQVQYRLSFQRDNRYAAVLLGLFQKVCLYWDTDRQIVYVYLGAEKTEDNERLLRIANHFFLDLQVETDVMWKGEHFGIIGLDESMKIGRTALI